MEDDLESDIRAAMAETLEATPAAAPVETTPEPVQTQEPAPEGETAEQKESRQRDEQGRFKAKEQAEAQAPVAQEPAAAAEASQEKPIRPPLSWSPEAKARFMSADPAIQKEILKREDDMNKGRQAWESKAEAANRMEKVLTPHRERFAQSGVDDAQAVASLLNAEQRLRQDLPGGLAYLVNSYTGGNPQAVAQAIAQAARHFGLNVQFVGPQGEPQQAPQGAGPAIDPRLNQLAGEVSRISQHLTQQQQQQADAERARSLAEIDSVANDPKNIYFENVQPKIAALLRANQGDTRPIRIRVQEAYDQAVYADPTTRALIMAQERDAAEKAERDRKAKEAADAKRAGGSVTGSPGGTGHAQTARRAKDSIEDDIRAAMSEHGVNV